MPSRQGMAAMNKIPRVPKQDYSEHYAWIIDAVIVAMLVGFGWLVCKS